eukprot:comp4142_c0_seq1/m.710 comp4142_c0_seq1/g.710  ORF comp4142_c0_seq1/g.710 comp4142_c0_seq1/m.710 type:complete len:103 (+) comp4142_c0_seq1:153-461(+)
MNTYALNKRWWFDRFDWYTRTIPNIKLSQVATHGQVPHLTQTGAFHQRHCLQVSVREGTEIPVISLSPEMVRERTRGMLSNESVVLPTAGFPQPVISKVVSA